MDFHVPKIDPDNPGQLIIVWKRINQIADLLNKAPSVSAVTLALRQEGQRHWSLDGQGRTSIRLRD
ncbi:hypothetical protein BJX99DRAFT_232532 [Aspergillus californicus]